MTLTDWGIQTIPVITVIVFLIAEAVKITPLDNKWLPAICGFFGGVLGIVAMFIMPEFPAKDYLTAAAVGIVSGLGATGAHQIYRQLTKPEAAGTHLEPTGPAVGEEDHEYTAEDIINEIKNE